MAEQTLEQAQTEMDVVVSRKAAAERVYRRKRAELADLRKKRSAQADAECKSIATILAEERAASLKLHNAAIAKAGAMVRKASQIESRKRAEARAAASPDATVIDPSYTVDGERADHA